VIGHAPRHLDRNIATVGRVVEGWSLLTARGAAPKRSASSRIPSITFRSPDPLAADLPARERPALQVLRSDTPTFSPTCSAAPIAAAPSSTCPAGGVDLCNVNVPVRRRP
jgi:peptidylprolyl isomerase